MPTCIQFLVLVIGMVTPGCQSPPKNKADQAPSTKVVMKTQSKEAALREMCSLPEDLMDDLSQIGPHLETRILNREVRQLLATMDDGQKLRDVLATHAIDPETCDLIRAIEAP